MKTSRMMIMGAAAVALSMSAVAAASSETHGSSGVWPPAPHKRGQFKKKDRVIKSKKRSRKNRKK